MAVLHFHKRASWQPPHNSTRQLPFPILPFQPVQDIPPLLFCQQRYVPFRPHRDNTPHGHHPKWQNSPPVQRRRLFLLRKSLVWLNLVFLCSLLRKSKHGIRFFVSFSILQLSRTASVSISGKSSLPSKREILPLRVGQCPSWLRCL